MNKPLTRLLRDVVASTYRNPDSWFVDWATGGTTDSGVAVNSNTAMNYSTVWACADLVTSDVGTLPLNDTNIDVRGDRTINLTSDVQWLLNSEPNARMTAFDLRRTVQLHAMLVGNGYAAIQRDNVNTPLQIIPMWPSNVTPYVDADGMVWYDVTGLDNPLPGRDVIHIKGLGGDGLCGYSVITKARNSLGLGLAEERHGSSHFKNGASPRIVLKTNRTLDEPEADLLLKQWGEKQEGSENAGKTALAAGGLEVEALPISNEDAQWLESRKFQREEVAAWFGVPVHMVGGEKGPYNSTIAENQAYLRRTLKKWLCAWEQECERKLIPERVRRTGTRRLMHDPSSLLNSDPETKAKIASDLVAAEIWTRNEARRSLGSNRHDDPIADRLSSPNTRTDNSSEPTGPSQEAISAHRALMSDRMSKLIDTEKRNIARGCKTKDFVNWLENFYQRFGQQVQDALTPIVTAFASIPGVSCTVSAAELAEMHISQSKSALLEVAGISFTDNLADNVAALTDQWTSRAEDAAGTIIGTES